MTFPIVPAPPNFIPQPETTAPMPKVGSTVPEIDWNNNSVPSLGGVPLLIPPPFPAELQPTTEIVAPQTETEVILPDAGYL